MIKIAVVPNDTASSSRSRHFRAVSRKRRLISFTRDLPLKRNYLFLEGSTNIGLQGMELGLANSFAGGGIGSRR